jgi:hypothetical protein
MALVLCRQLMVRERIDRGHFQHPHAGHVVPEGYPGRSESHVSRRDEFSVSPSDEQQSAKLVLAFEQYRHEHKRDFP